MIIFSKDKTEVTPGDIVEVTNNNTVGVWQYVAIHDKAGNMFFANCIGTLLEARKITPDNIKVVGKYEKKGYWFDDYLIIK